MLGIIFLTVVVAAAAGLVVKLILDRKGTEQEITWIEFAIGVLVISIILAPATAYVGWKLARGSLVSYEEYWNGWETGVSSNVTTCTRDGACRHEYNCDPYIVMVSYSCNCDSKGNCQTCYRPETRYHDCPYVDKETDFAVQTTLGEYTISENRFPDNPQAHRWRQSESIPQSVIESAGVGIPPFWAAVKSRLESSDPGPVSCRKGYENYILASDQTILKQYSGEIVRFRASGLLPAVQSGLFDFYLADKTYFVGYRPSDPVAWQKAMRYLDAALGSELQGDLHLVLVQNAEISNNPDAFALALRAHWQDKTAFGKNCLSKNGIVVIVGSDDGRTVRWARAFTGMPIGNEAMTTAFRNNLKGIPLTPESVIGQISGKHSGSKIIGTHGQGAIEKIVWGLDAKDTKFKRVSMKGGKADDNGSGYLYLYGEIQPTKGQKIWIGIVSFLVSGLVWLVAAMAGVRNFSRRRGM